MPVSIGSFFVVLAGITIVTFCFFGTGRLSGEKKPYVTAFFLSLILYGIVVAMLFSFAQTAYDNGRGSPATSLEPGIYYVYEGIWTEKGWAILLDADPPDGYAEPLNIAESPRFVLLDDVSLLDSDFRCDPDCDLPSGWYEVSRVTKTYAHNEFTRIVFSKIQP